MKLEGNKIAFINLKAFGDFVIFMSVIRCYKNSNDYISLIIGRHLWSLYSVLGSNLKYEIIETVDVPAAFDLRKKGICNGLKSLMFLRSRIDKISKKSNNKLFFDSHGWRELIISGRFNYLSLKNECEDNIYKKYRSFFDKYYENNILINENNYGAVNFIGIFPESRVNSKKIPAQIVLNIYFNSIKAGFSPIIFIMEDVGEYNSYGVNIVRMKKNFGELIEAIKKMDAIFSADSLPAHLAEYLNTPVYVATPRTNLYWLPEYSYDNGTWGLFSDILESGKSVKEYLYRLRDY